MTAAALAAAPLPALTEGQRPHAALASDGYAFQLHLPPGRGGAEAAARYPLMIFLHGSGERGANLDQVKAHGPPKIAARDPSFPFLLISPQLPADQDWDLDKLRTILAWALKSLPADPDRSSLPGLAAAGMRRGAGARPSRDDSPHCACRGAGRPATACASRRCRCGLFTAIATMW